MPDDTTGRIDELRDGYALGLLEGEELAELRGLLESPGPAQDLACGAVRGSQQTVALLAWSIPPALPPAGLRDRILTAVASGAPGELPLPTERGPGRLGYARFIGWMGWAGWAAAAGLGGIALVTNTRLNGTAQSLAALKQQATVLRGQLAQRDRVLSVISAGDSRSIRLVNTAPQTPQYRAYWSATAGLVLAGNGIARPLAGRTLQLWIVPKKGAPVSAGVFAPTDKGEVLLIAANIAAPELAQALAISDEPTGGSPQPTTQPGWIGAVGGF